MAERHEAVKGLKGSYEWLSLAASLPAKPLPFTMSTLSKSLYSGACILAGVYVNNGSGANNNFALYSGQDSASPVIYQNFLSSGNNATQQFGPRGVFCENGVFCVVAGTPFAGSLYIIDLWNYNWTPPGE